MSDFIIAQVNLFLISYGKAKPVALPKTTCAPPQIWTDFPMDIEKSARIRLQIICLRWKIQHEKHGLGMHIVQNAIKLMLCLYTAI